MSFANLKTGPNLMFYDPEQRTLTNESGVEVFQFASSSSVRNTPGLPETRYEKPRSQYDDDITFSINILMDRFRGLAGMIEDIADHHGELETKVKDINDQIYTLADCARHLANEGDLLARYCADELNRKDAK